MNALLFLGLLATAQADPGRTVLGATVGARPAEGLVLRGSLDYGFKRHFAVSLEAGSLPGESSLALGGGLLFAPLDGRWWRLGVAAMPELWVPLRLSRDIDPLLVEDPKPGIRTGMGDITLGLRSGLRINWLVFWGLTATARADRCFPLDGSGGWFELAGGLALRI